MPRIDGRFADSHQLQVFIDYRDFAALVKAMRSRGVEFNRQYSYLIRQTIEVLVEVLADDDDRFDSVVDAIQYLRSEGFTMSRRMRERLQSDLAMESPKHGKVRSAVDAGAVSALASEMREALERRG